MIRHVKNSSAYKLVVRTTCLFILLSAGFSSVRADENAGRRLYEAACVQCHGLAQIEQTRNGRAGWEDTVHKMVITGAQLDIEEMELVIDYLYQQHGPDASDPMRTGVLPFDSPLSKDGLISSENIVLPDAKGKNLIEGYCMMCHDLGRVVATRRGDKEWRGYVKDMLRRNSMNISDDQLNTMVSYLKQNFGK